jgi:hypothetical protein
MLRGVRGMLTLGRGSSPAVWRNPIQGPSTNCTTDVATRRRLVARALMLRRCLLQLSNPRLDRMVALARVAAAVPPDLVG